MKHYMNLCPEPFEMIRSGKKTIELRLNDEKRKIIKERTCITACGGTGCRDVADDAGEYGDGKGG